MHPVCSLRCLRSKVEVEGAVVAVPGAGGGDGVAFSCYSAPTGVNPPGQCFRGKACVPLGSSVVILHLMGGGDGEDDDDEDDDGETKDETKSAAGVAARVVAGGRVGGKQGGGGGGGGERR